MAHPRSAAAPTLRALVEALGGEGDFLLAHLYELDLDSFTLALALLREWRLDRHYATRLSLFDIATMGVAPRAERRRKPR